MTHRPRARRARMVAASVAAAFAAPALAMPAVATPDGPDQLYVDPFSTTLGAAAALEGQARADAQLLGSFSSATWFTGGTADEVGAAVTDLVGRASAADALPTLVAYNVPFRDCAQYSAGGATSTAEYVEWIDAFAAGIGDEPALVILEPDGLGIIPWYTTVDGEQEWCQPEEADPDTAAEQRFAQLNHAVDVLSALPRTQVYLDGTHSGWLGVGDVSDRLIRAGVERADGFFLNASNYVETERLLRYGTWISDCVHLSVHSWWEPQWCASQYYPADPDDFSTWPASDAAYDQAFADTGVERDPAAQAHFVVDTSRNGQGPWTEPSGELSDPEVWCNPPDRGLGARPTLETGSELVDAYLWVKVPGESDGKCFRGTDGPLDPVRGIEDPAAGEWFPEQAAELLELAVPPVDRPTCQVEYTVHGTWAGGYIAQVWLRTTGTVPLDGWSLRWTLADGERITDSWSADVDSAGAEVVARDLGWNGVLRPGDAVTFGFVGSRGDAAPGVPQLVTLDGDPCAVVS